MDFDPLSRDTAISRYDIESGSEDEYDGPVASASKPVRPVLVRLDPDMVTAKGLEMIVLIGEAGKACLGASHAPLERVTVTVDEMQQASIAVTDSHAVVYISSVPKLSHRQNNQLASHLLDRLQPSTVTLFDSYGPSEASFDSAPDAAQKLRYLATPDYSLKRLPRSTAAPLESPASATGLGAAFLSQAVVRGAPALLGLLEDVRFQAHVQLYGSSTEISSPIRIAPLAAQAIRSILPPLDSKSAPSPTSPTIIDFAKGRRAVNSKLTLGDGSMYI
ncbi:hypothetical protein BCV70DRAFT_166909 [Testicularia cyperi]|uniref:Proteasome assembly chaperone 1 n=1 Tax=Testicularia cyperi TaxID=1882483 RepID=A0A317XH20_9BASI|nr:hypothetical protein BCV70DRAFT_166909 [Testicularia cyperi]